MRDRPAQLAPMLTTLEAQAGRLLPIIVVDQSKGSDPELERRVKEGPRLTLIRDVVSGLSRARNLGWQRASSEWVVFLDDDCLIEGDWAEELERALERHPEAAFIRGHVAEHDVPEGDYLVVSAFTVERESPVGALDSSLKDRPPRLHGGPPQDTSRPGRFDERLGAGMSGFPAVEDMDLNYRLLRTGGVAYVTPRVRSLQHTQWPELDWLAQHYRGYIAGWSGFAIKHLRTGDLLGGVWLWRAALLDVTRMFASLLRRRARNRLKVASWKLRGLSFGTVKRLGTSW